MDSEEVFILVMLKEPVGILCAGVPGPVAIQFSVNLIRIVLHGELSVIIIVSLYQGVVELMSIVQSPVIHAISILTITPTLFVPGAHYFEVVITTMYSVITSNLAADLCVVVLTIKRPRWAAPEGSIDIRLLSSLKDSGCTVKPDEGSSIIGEVCVQVTRHHNICKVVGTTNTSN